ncbi:hypothetical protein GCM10009573_07900 [Agromyces bracchium]
MNPLSLTAVSTVLAVLAVYPFTIYPLALRLLKTRPLQFDVDPMTDSTGETFALFFSFFNEASSMPEKVDNLRAIRAAYPNIELWAYDDCSDDDSAAILEDSDVDIRLVRGRERLGKAHGMKVMVGMTDRDLLVFTDANVTVDPESIGALARCYKDQEVGGVCGTLHYRSAAGTSTESVGGAYWRLEEFIKSEESRSGNVMGADGSIFSIRRELYPDFPDSVQDDFTVSMAVVFANRRLIRSEDVRAFEELVSRRRLEIRRKVRISTRAFHTHQQFGRALQSLSWRDKWCYFSHKWLRWHSGFCLILGIGCSVWAIGVVSIWAGLAVLVGIVGLAVWAFKRSQGVAAAVSDVVASLVAASVGTVYARSGKTMSTWQPPRTP